MKEALKIQDIVSEADWCIVKVRLCVDPGTRR